MKKRMTIYFKQHPMANGIVHAIGGIGIGVLIASPIANPHPVRFGLSLITLSLLGHFYAWQMGKK